MFETPVDKKKRRDQIAPLFFVFPVTLRLCGEKTLVPDTIHKRPQLPRARWMSQFPQRLRFDLANAFACDRERLADFFERMLAAVFETKAHLDDFFFARCQRAQ